MEWISVNDKLPSNSDEVLVYDVENDEVIIGVYLYSKPTFPVFGIFGRGQVFDITHWMPLPSPPKE